MREWSWLNRINLLALLVATLGLFVVFSQLAYAAGRRTRRRAPSEVADISTFVPTTIFGLLAIILGFSFSLATSLYEHRWQLVVTEANAIGTTFLRSRVLQSLPHEQFEERLKAYVDARIDAYGAPFPSDRLRNALEKVAWLQRQLWRDAVQATRVDRGPVESLFLAGLNEVFDLQNERDYAMRRTMPETIYLFIILIATMGLAAYNFGRGYNGDSGQWKPIGLAIMLAIVFCLINDLDRPRRGIIRVSQDAMTELRKSMDRME